MGPRPQSVKKNPLAMFSNCGAHSLNLYGAKAAGCCSEIISFSELFKKRRTFFLEVNSDGSIWGQHIGCSLHGVSHTRWSARVDSIKPFAKHLPLIKKALECCKSFNLSAECKTDLRGLIKYFYSFQCVLISTLWLLSSVDIINKVLQSRDATLVVEKR